MSKKYFNLDNKNLWQKTASYNRLKGKRVPVIEKGERKYIKVSEGIKGYLAFVLSKNEDEAKKGNNQVESKKESHNNKEEKQQREDEKRMEEQQIAPEDQDEYIPQDMEFGESEKEGPYMFQISPPLLGYYNSGKKSYFNKKRLIWSKKKKLGNINHNTDKSQKKHLFKGRLKKGIFSIPLPNGALPDISSLVASGTVKPQFRIDQNNCIYLESNSIQEIAFEFYTNQQINTSAPIPQDKEKIVKGKLTSPTKSLISQLKTSTISSRDKGKQLVAHIQNNKTYNEKKQGELFKISNPKNYFYNLDNSESLECFSSNTLLVGLCRELGIAARIITGHYIDKISPKGTTNLGQNTGHAWTEIWDEENSEWLRLDATPPKEQKKDGEENDKGEGNENEGGDKEQGDEKDKGGKKGKLEETKSPQEALEEMIEQIQNENFEKQKEQLEKEKQDIENSSSSKEAKNKLENSDRTEKAKEILEEEANKKMLELEREKLEKAEEENEVDDAVNNSNIDDPRYKKLLKRYSDLIKEKIKERKRREEGRMRNYGFSPEEMRLYKKYLELEKEVKPEIKRNIKALEKILPKEYKIIEERHYFSGKRLDKRKLVNYVVSKDSRVFVRHREEVEDIKVNMYETIVIDRSGSMGNADNIGSPMREAIKAAIIRAKTLEYFKVNFSIVIFDDDVEEVMEFGEKFTAKKTKIPAKLMRALQKSGGTDISAPLLYVKGNMKKYSRKIGKKAVGNITFIGDGQPYGGIVGEELRVLIDKIKKYFPITAFYISNYSQDGQALEKYFGTAESGGTVIIPDVSHLSKGIIQTFNKNIKGILKRIQKKNI